MADALVRPAEMLRVLTCGSVDDGKSTLIGRLLFECGQVADDVLATLRQDSRQWGTADGGIDYALLVDGLSAEREQGITIDVAYRFLDTPQRRVILADTPGHAQYTRNMVTGASTADVAILLVDVRHGLLAQTRRHAAIVALLGIRHIVLAVNKIDLVGYRQAAFDAVAGGFAAFAASLGGLGVTALPICARDGDNVTRRSAATPWYDGPALLELLDRTPAAAAATPAFRMPVQWVNRPDAGFRGFSGTVAAGTVWPGLAVQNVTAGVSAVVARIVTLDGDLAEAAAGAAVTLVLDRAIDVARGDVLAAEPLPAMADRVTARMVWLDETPLFPGRPYQVMLGTRSLTATIDAVASRLNVETLAEDPARDLRLNEIGRVEMSFAQPVAFEPYGVSRALGSFIVIDRLTRATVGAGMIESGETRSSDVHWHRLDVDQALRAALKQQRPAVLWFTGLSGAGKSTIANLVERRLHALGRHTMLLDGDRVRHGLNRDLGFSEADRVENIRRVAEVAKLFVEAGLIVLVSFISPYRSERLLARGLVAEGEFLEIFVDTPIEECRRRDPKGLYARADAGKIANFTGVDAPYEAPEAAEIWLRTLEGAPEVLADRVVAELRVRGVVRGG